MPPHVLIVEDSPIVVAALRLLLEETGHRVSAAGTVRDAVALALAERPDLILLDLTLGAEDGLVVLRELEHAGAPGIVTVAVTGHDEAAIRERCVRAGCRDVLLKPIAPLALPRQISDWLRGAAGGGVEATT
ncbi:MAG TPA: response regulator [Gemmatimonadaceae bacterium]|nr:response regulator [Gemmatimonadaceae bacterium]